MKKQPVRQTEKSLFKPGLKMAKKQAGGILVSLICLWMILIGIGLEAANCKLPSFYNARSWTWQYANTTCNPNYNCLGFATGSMYWEWPWGGYPTSSQVDTYLTSKGYYTSGSNPAIISYGSSSSSIAHFAQVTGPNSTMAKWGALDLLIHNSWDPYTALSGYGTSQRVYYATPPVQPMSVFIDGPDCGFSRVNYTWTAYVSDGTPPYTYQWYYNNFTGNYTYCGSSSSLTRQLEYNKGMLLKVVVTSSTGEQATYEDFIVGNMDSGAYQDLNSSSIENSIGIEMTNLFNTEFENHATSSNPYDYINNDYFKKIVQMGPEALMTIRQMIRDSNENGFREYILAIAAEKIARVNLKGDKFLWSTGRAWTWQWDLHIMSLPETAAKIFNSDMSIKEKNEALIKLGTPVLPFILDEIACGNTQYNIAFRVLTRDSGSSPEMTDGEDALEWAQKNEDTVRILREIVEAYQQ